MTRSHLLRFLSLRLNSGTGRDILNTENSGYKCACLQEAEFSDDEAEQLYRAQRKAQRRCVFSGL
jgi:hypothetical protein